MLEPGAMLADLLAEYGIEKTTLGDWLNVTYLTVNRWTKNEHFNEENQQLVLKALRKAVDEGRAHISVELGDNYFTEQAERARRARRAHRASVIELFETTTKVGRSLTAAERRKLELIDLGFLLDVELCQALVLSARGQIQGDPFVAAAHQRRLKRSAKRPRKTADPD